MAAGGAPTRTQEARCRSPRRPTLAVVTDEPRDPDPDPDRDPAGPVGGPTGEPVVAHGPFVMTTREEIGEAIRDYQAGLFGPAPAI